MFIKSKKNITTTIVLYELIAFICVVLIIWFITFFEIPTTVWGSKYLNSAIISNLIETVLFIFIFIFIMTISYRFLQHIKHLEGFLHICSYCKKVKVDNVWMPLDDFLRMQTDANWSHGLCDECMQKQYGDMLQSLSLIHI